MHKRVNKTKTQLKIENAKLQTRIAELEKSASNLVVCPVVLLPSKKKEGPCNYCIEKKYYDCDETTLGCLWSLELNK
jgi:hypothetical protein